MNTNGNTYYDENNIDDKYKKLYIRLVNSLKDAVNIINASDYSKKSLGQFKEKVEKMVYRAEKHLK
jgi:predicted DNA-binding ArsR family transcriptional regulator